MSFHVKPRSLLWLLRPHAGAIFCLRTLMCSSLCSLGLDHTNLCAVPWTWQASSDLRSLGIALPLAWKSLFISICAVSFLTSFKLCSIISLCVSLPLATPPNTTARLSGHSHPLTLPSFLLTFSFLLSTYHHLTYYRSSLDITFIIYHVSFPNKFKLSGAMVGLLVFLLLIDRLIGCNFKFCYHNHVCP